MRSYLLRLSLLPHPPLMGKCGKNEKNFAHRFTLLMLPLVKKKTLNYFQEKDSTFFLPLMPPLPSHVLQCKANEGNQRTERKLRTFLHFVLKWNEWRKNSSITNCLIRFNYLNRKIATTWHDAHTWRVHRVYASFCSSRFPADDNNQCLCAFIFILTIYVGKNVLCVCGCMWMFIKIEF